MGFLFLDISEQIIFTFKLTNWQICSDITHGKEMGIAFNSFVLEYYWNLGPGRFSHIYVRQGAHLVSCRCMPCTCVNAQALICTILDILVHSVNITSLIKSISHQYPNIQNQQHRGHTWCKKWVPQQVLVCLHLKQVGMWQ